MINNSVFGKIMENVKNHRDISQQKQENLIGISTKLPYNKVFIKNILVKKMRKTQALTNKSVYLGLLKLEISKILMYEYYVKPKYEKKVIMLFGYK